MTLTPHEKQLVTDSFLVAVHDTDRLTHIFYDRLFETLPAAREMFRKTNMQAQGIALTRMLDRLVEGANNPDLIQAEMTELAKRHSRYGVNLEHYPQFGEALLWTFEQILENKFTFETRLAWQKAYQLFVDAVGVTG